MRSRSGKLLLRSLTVVSLTVVTIFLTDCPPHAPGWTEEMIRFYSVVLQSPEPEDRS